MFIQFSLLFISLRLLLLFIKYFLSYLHFNYFFYLRILSIYSLIIYSIYNFYNTFILFILGILNTLFHFKFIIINSLLFFLLNLNYINKSYKFELIKFKKDFLVISKKINH